MSSPGGQRVPIWAGASNMIRRTPLKVIFDDPTTSSAAVEAAYCEAFKMDATLSRQLVRSSRADVSNVKPFTQDTLRRDAQALRAQIVREALAAQASGVELRVLCVGPCAELLVQLGLRADRMFMPSTLKPQRHLARIGVAHVPARGGVPDPLATTPAAWSALVASGDGSNVRRVRISRDGKELCVFSLAVWCPMRVSSQRLVSSWIGANPPSPPHSPRDEQPIPVVLLRDLYSGVTHLSELHIDALPPHAGLDARNPDGGSPRPVSAPPVEPTPPMVLTPAHLTGYHAMHMDRFRVLSSPRSGSPRSPKSPGWRTLALGKATVGAFAAARQSEGGASPASAGCGHCGAGSPGASAGTA